MIINRKKTTSFILILFLFFFGLDWESVQLMDSNFLSYSTNQQAYLMMGPLLMAIAIFIWIGYLAKRWNQFNWLTCCLLFLVCSFATGWLAAEYNDFVDTWLGQQFDQSAFLDYLLAFTGAVGEEVIKLVLVGLLAHCLNYKTPAQLFIIGCLVGLGFQWVEDLSYVFLAENLDDSLVTAITRLSNGFCSHWVYSGITGYALSHWFSTDQKIQGPKAIGLICLIILLHFIWNSPLSEFFLLPITLNLVTALIYLTIVLILDHQSINPLFKQQTLIYFKQ